MSKIFTSMIGIRDNVSCSCNKKSFIGEICAPIPQVPTGSFSHLAWKKNDVSGGKWDEQHGPRLRVELHSP